jgi:non-heme chloroperoxidase
MDTYAADLAELTAALDLKDAVHVGHSTGGGEALRYTVRHGKGRVSKLVMISAVPPLMLQTPTNHGLPMKVFDGIRAGVASNRSQLFIDFAPAFYGYNRQGAKTSQGVSESFWLQGMLGGTKGLYDCIKAFSETDFTDDLKEVRVPTLIIQGDDDQIVPFALSGQLQAKLVKGAVLKVYTGAPHGLTTTHSEKVNDDLLEFIRA